MTVLLSGRDKKEFQDLIVADNYYFFYVATHSHVESTTPIVMVINDMVIFHTAELGLPTYTAYDPYFETLFNQEYKKLTTNVIFGEYGARAEHLKYEDPNYTRYRFFSAFFPNEPTLNKTLSYSKTDIEDRKKRKTKFGIYMYDPRTNATTFLNDSDTFFSSGSQTTTSVINKLKTEYPDRLHLYFFNACSSAVLPASQNYLDRAKILNVPFYTLPKNSRVPSLSVQITEEKVNTTPITISFKRDERPYDTITVTQYAYEPILNIYKKIKSMVGEKVVIYFTLPSPEGAGGGGGEQTKFYFDGNRTIADYYVDNLSSYNFFFKTFKKEGDADDFITTLSTMIFGKEKTASEFIKNLTVYDAQPEIMFKNPFMENNSRNYNNVIPNQNKRVNARNIARAKGEGYVVSPPFKILIMNPKTNTYLNFDESNIQLLLQMLSSYPPYSHIVELLYHDTAMNIRSLKVYDNMFLTHYPYSIINPPLPTIPLQYYKAPPFTPIPFGTAPPTLTFYSGPAVATAPASSLGAAGGGGGASAAGGGGGASAAAGGGGAPPVAPPVASAPATATPTECKNGEDSSSCSIMGGGRRKKKSRQTKKKSKKQNKRIIK